MLFTNTRKMLFDIKPICFFLINELYKEGISD